MSWIKHKSPPPEAGAPISVSSHMARQRKGHTQPHVDRETEERIAEFLIRHGRLAPRPGRPLIQLLGTTKNHHDETVDYSVRTRVRMHDSTTKTFDSHIREYPDLKKLRLIR